MQFLMTCDACGAHEFTTKEGYRECNFCGSKYMIQNDFVFSKALTDSRITELYRQSVIYMEKGNHAAELQTLKEALALDPLNSTTLTKIGRCYRTMGMINEAIQSYQQAIQIDPTAGTAYTNMGTIYVLQGNWLEAAKQYQMGLPYIDRDSNDYWTAYANYAIVVAKRGLPKSAEQMISEAENHGYKNGNACRAAAGLTKKGCYVATCVYHSYDCPEVWTLRRFRDDSLSASAFGRAFIKFYYRVSPTLVKRFGNYSWFRKSCKAILDPFVRRLQNRGYASTRYED